MRLVVPLTDLDHVKLVRARDELGALVLLPSEDVVRRVGDKYLAHLFFEERGIPSPPSWLPDEVPDDARYPLLVKVREGFGSRHIYRAHDRAELEFFLALHAGRLVRADRAARARSSRSTSSATSTAAA